jgi:predicted AlkP superfamily pyrophosphatase or phosphodiesterase
VTPLKLERPPLQRLLAAVGVALCMAVPGWAHAKPPLKHPLILVSIDGFRPDYLDRGVTPVMSALAREGVRGAMHPSFPALTYPNHYTLVTGLRPDHHGVVDNVMEIPSIDPKPFTMMSPAMVGDRRWWDGGEPIWVTANNQGLRTATLFWPGSEAPIHGVRPTYWKLFQHDMTASARVDQILAWLDLPAAQRPSLLTLYFDVVDTAGHAGGPAGQGVNRAAADVDAAIGRLMAGLKARGLSEANVVIVADHGMADIGPDRVVRLEDLMPASSFRAVTTGAVADIEPAPGQEPAVEAALLAAHDHMQCWRKGEIPERFHYGAHARIPPIVCLAQTGWQIVDQKRMAEKPVVQGGAHGFDPTALEMQAVFIAHGAAFRQGVTLPVFDNVSLYPLLARVLAIRPRANDGAMGDVAGAFRPTGDGR